MGRGGARQGAGRKSVLDDYSPGSEFPLWLHVGQACEAAWRAERSRLLQDRLDELLSDYNAVVSRAQRLTLSQRRRWFDNRGRPRSDEARGYLEDVQAEIEDLGQALSATRQGVARGRLLSVKVPRPSREAIISQVREGWENTVPGLTARRVEAAWKAYRKFERDIVDGRNMDVL